MRSNWSGPANIGSDEMVTINQLAAMAMTIAEKHLDIHHVPGPLGVRGRNSDNKLIAQRLDWQPSLPLVNGLETTYRWIAKQVAEHSAPQLA